MGCGKWRHITLMHRVTTPEKHGIRHPRAIEMAPFRTRILSGIDVRPNDIAVFIHIIAELGRDVLRIFRNHGVMSRRSPKTGFPGGDSRLADQSFALVKV